MTTTTIPSRARSVDDQTTAGVDVGSSAVKIAVLLTTGGGETEVLALLTERVRRRELRRVVNDGYQAALSAAGVAPKKFVMWPAPAKVSWWIFAADTFTA